MRIAVCAPQVPFARGGAEIFAETLVDELRRRDHVADLVTVPFKWYPGTKVLSQAFLWRLVDLEEADGQGIDLVVATKFPAYCVRHPRKVAWVLHQFRQAYDYDRTELGQFSESAEDRATRQAVDRLDRTCLAECGHVFATSENVASRLRRYSDVEAEILPHPPARLPYRTDGYEGFILSVNRLDRAKRIDLLLEAAEADPAVRVVIAGDGPDRERLEQLAAKSGLNGRVEFRGRVPDEELVDLYARCRAVYYAPVDEDFGMVPYEAFLSEKPVLTTVDAGGPLAIVRDRETGLVTEPEPAALARACSELTADENAARTWGRAGKAIAETVTWDRAIDRLLAHA